MPTRRLVLLLLGSALFAAACTGLAVVLSRVWGDPWPWRQSAWFFVLLFGYATAVPWWGPPLRRLLRGRRRQRKGDDASDSARSAERREH